MQPVPATRGVADLQELQDSDEHVGVVIRQRAGQQAVDVVQLDVEAEHGKTRESSPEYKIGNTEREGEHI